VGRDDRRLGVQIPAVGPYVRRIEEDLAMLIPVVIFVVCLAGGAVASARWLPDLAAGPIGGSAFFVVCGLAGASLALVGLHVYSIANALNTGGFAGIRNAKAEIMASGLQSALWEAGSLFALAAAVFLLAPRAEAIEDPADDPVV
jgi:hypothetical protein